jgi:SOS-response transcriptional repressor LexA
MPKNYENDSQHECPILAAVGHFWVKITGSIKDRCLVQPGEFLLIDPVAEPRHGQLVIVDDTIEPYTNQVSIGGVVVLAWGEVN